MVGDNVVQGGNGGTSDTVEGGEDDVTEGVDLSLEPVGHKGSVGLELEWLVLDEVVGNFVYPLFKELSLFVEHATFTGGLGLNGGDKSVEGIVSDVINASTSSVDEVRSLLVDSVADLVSALSECFVHDVSAGLVVTFFTFEGIIKTVQEVVLSLESLVDECPSLIWVNIGVDGLKRLPEELEELFGNVAWDTTWSDNLVEVITKFFFQFVFGILDCIINLLLGISSLIIVLVHGFWESISNALLLVSNDFFNIFDDFIDEVTHGSVHKLFKESVEVIELVLDLFLHFVWVAVVS